MEKPHINIIIATPGHSLMGSYVSSLIKTGSELSKRGISWLWTNQYCSHVGDAREATLAGTLQNIISENRPLHGEITYDRIMWIDSDIAWEPEDIIKLYESDKDIISGAYISGYGEVMAYPKMFKQGYTIEELNKLNGVTEIESCGFGFVCIKNGVFESLTRPWFQSTMGNWIDSKTNKEYEFAIMGEDISFCKRVKDKGYNIWIDPSVRVLHHKTMKLTWEGPRP